VNNTPRSDAPFRSSKRAGPAAVTKLTRRSQCVGRADALGHSLRQLVPACSVTAQKAEQAAGSPRSGAPRRTEAPRASQGCDCCIRFGRGVRAKRLSEARRLKLVINRPPGWIERMQSWKTPDTNCESSCPGWLDDNGCDIISINGKARGRRTSTTSISVKVRTAGCWKDLGLENAVGREPTAHILTSRMSSTTTHTPTGKLAAP
jgi:hypothetical protein